MSNSLRHLEEIGNIGKELQKLQAYSEATLVGAIAHAVLGIYAKLEECLPSTPSSSTTGKSDPSPSPAPSSSDQATPSSSTPAGAD